MQALVKKGKGEGNLGIEEVAVPEPGSKDVLIKVKAGAVCGSDLHIMYDRVPCAIPVVIGHEFSGVIEEVGSSVKGWKRSCKERSSSCNNRFDHSADRSVSSAMACWKRIWRRDG